MRSSWQSLATVAYCCAGHIMYQVWIYIYIHIISSSMQCRVLPRQSVSIWTSLADLVRRLLARSRCALGWILFPLRKAWPIRRCVCVHTYISYSSSNLQQHDVRITRSIEFPTLLCVRTEVENIIKLYSYVPDMLWESAVKTYRYCCFAYLVSWNLWYIDHQGLNVYSSDGV